MAKLQISRRNLVFCGSALFAATALGGCTDKHPTETQASTDTPDEPTAMAQPTAPHAPRPVDRANWAQFRRHFMGEDGRIIDTGNGGVSHSEGQGYGMLFAEWMDDRTSFERIWTWTQTNLARPQNALHAWRVKPGSDDPADRNDATDGELYMAWALRRAFDRWGDPTHREASLAISRDILRLSVRKVAGLTILLPGSEGFEHRGSVVINPSYYAFPAIRALAAADPHPDWARLEADGARLLEAARFGEWDLPPDWLQLSTTDHTLTPAATWAPRFSFDAARVPLHLAWAGMRNHPALQSAEQFWRGPKQPYAPAWTDLRTNEIAPYKVSTGMGMIATLAGCTCSLAKHPPSAKVTGADDYYSAALVLLSGMAARESGVA